MLPWLLAGLAGLALAGCCFEWWGARRDRRRYPAPGRIIPADGSHWHAEIVGAGKPVVVFEAGLAASSLNWRLVTGEVARWTRVCAYDRAGLGYSGDAAPPRTASNCTEELHEMLERAGIPAPYVLVGHSFGGLIIRLFTLRYPDEVAGLVFVDPLLPHEWRHPDATQRKLLRRALFLARRGAMLARCGIPRLALTFLGVGAHNAARLITRVSSGGVTFVDRFLGEVRKLPRDTWPLIGAHWSRPRNFTTMARFLERLPESCGEVPEDAPLGDIPVIVLAGGDLDAAKLAAMERLARLSPRGELRVAAGSRHWVQLDQPELVIGAVRDVAARVNGTAA
ncbi:MAG: alpha/beta hydrolase [Acidobacteria bacterium]|nr:alpha/beta hydrolase [Acidobacteriota bacterium]